MDIIFKYFPYLSTIQIDQFRKLESLYSNWNSKINVISRKDIDHLAERHILHSLAIAALIRFKNGTKILDAGTGGGFPGIPLAIFFPEAQFHLVDSIGKKISVVNAIAGQLNLQNVTAEKARVEEIPGSFDFVVSRAVTSLPEFLSWVTPLVSANSFNDLQNGILYLKGGDFGEELRSIKGDYRIYSVSEYFKEEYFETKKIIHITHF